MTNNSAKKSRPASYVNSDPVQTDDVKIWFHEHKLAQILRQAEETTPADRLRFVEDTLSFLDKAGISYNDRKRQFGG